MNCPSAFCLPGLAPQRLTWLLFGALLLAGCAGLDYVGSTPPANAVLPAESPVVEVRFAHPLAPTKAAASLVALTQGDERIPVRVGLNSAGDGLRVEPLVPLRPGVEARLVLEAGVQGLGRRRSRAPVEVRFQVAGAGLAPMKSKSFQLQGGVGPAR